MLKEYETLRAAIEAAEKNPLNTIHVLEDTDNILMELDEALDGLRFLVDEEEDKSTIEADHVEVPPIVAETAIPVIEPEVLDMVEESDNEIPEEPVNVIRQPKMSKEEFVRSMSKLKGNGPKGRGRPRKCVD